mgnify:CR=1 FL=1
MKITDLLKPESIWLHGSAESKDDAIRKLVDLQEKGGALNDKEAYRQAILAREAQTSTAIEAGIAVPHAKSSSVNRPSLAAMTLDQGVDYESMDGEPSDLFFMIAAPEGSDEHLEILSRLMMMLMDADFCAKLRAADSAEAFRRAIDAEEKVKYPQDFAGEEAPKDRKPAEKTAYRVLAVTACPTGIAHTYMAAEALNKAGEAMNISIKVETNGSGGVKNLLTAEEISEAEGIIVAADKKVDTARFNGKKVIMTKVADGIHKPEELINRIVAGDAPVHHESASADSVQVSDDESVGRRFYKHLMSGVSHMLPFVIGGGILIALAFLLDNYAINPANFGMNTPVAAFFKTVGGTAFGFMLPILAGYIAYSIADRPGLAVGFVGGALAAGGNSFWDITAKSGVSGGFLGALLAGFIGGYIVLYLKKLTSKLPESMDGIRPILIYPLAGIFLMGSFMFLVNPVMAGINTGITGLLNSMGSTSKILLGCILGGMMSIDMGGPINKAAYVFGTASLATGNYDIMAAVMVGGMIPPLAIALCTTVFPKKFTADERKSGIVNYIMGLCFITEGAIPFAAADPLHVIPACVVGSAAAGGISMLMGCTLRAPHGGIFVFPVVGNVGGYLLALVVGSVVGMLMLSILKKNKEA